jgi:hypothetical protein
MKCFLLNTSLIFFHPMVLARMPDLEKISVYSSKFFHNFQLSESSFTCPELRATGLQVQIVFIICSYGVYHIYVHSVYHMFIAILYIDLDVYVKNLLE